MTCKKFCAVLLAIFIAGSIGLSLRVSVYALEEAEILANGDFSIWSGTAAASWSASGWGTKIKSEPNGGRNNSAGILMTANSYVSQWRTDFSDDTKYTLTAWFCGSGTVQIVTDWYEKWNPVSGPLSATNSDQYVFSTGETWEKLTYTFRPLENATTMLLYVKTLGAATLYADDISLKADGAPLVADFAPEHVFYYTEWENGTINLTPNVTKYPSLSGGKVRFSVRDDEERWQAEMPITGEDVISVRFPLVHVLSEKGKTYTARAEVYDKSGALLETFEEPVHRYDRPKYIGADGIFRKDGNCVNPVLMTGLGVSGNYKGAASLGATVAAAYSNVTNARIDYIGNIFMDDVGGVDPDGKPDLYTAVLLYSNGKPAGHPDNIANTKAKVQELKDNKNLFGYAIMDEPFAAMSAETAKALLMASYKAIRDIDPYHPIYLVEVRRSFYKEAAKYCDILFPDVYPGSSADKGDYVAKMTDWAVEAGREMQKPVCILHQAYAYGGWEPMGVELRNSIYRSMMHGARGFGYYCFDNAVGNSSLKETDMGIMLETFAKEEQEFLFDLFLRGEKKAESTSDAGIWQAITLDGANYLVALNRSMEKDNSVSVSLPPGSRVQKLYGEGAVQMADGLIRVPLPLADVSVFSVQVPEESAFTAHAPILGNGDMEAVASYGNYPSGWDRVAAGLPKLDTMFAMTDENEAHSGLSCAKIGGIAGNPYVYYQTDYTHGANYEISFYFKYKEAAKKGVPRIEVRNGIWGEVILDGVTGATYENTISGINADTWVKCTYHFTAPNAGTEPLAICLFGGAETVCCYDDLVLRHAESGIRFINENGEMYTDKTKSPAKVMAWYYPEGTQNITVGLTGSIYHEMGGARELLCFDALSENTNGKAVTLRMDYTPFRGKTAEIRVWENWIKPIFEKDIKQ